MSSSSTSPLSSSPNAPTPPRPLSPLDSEILSLTQNIATRFTSIINSAITLPYTKTTKNEDGNSSSSSSSPSSPSSLFSLPSSFYSAQSHHFLLSFDHSLQLSSLINSLHSLLSLIDYLTFRDIHSSSPSSLALSPEMHRERVEKWRDEEREWREKARKESLRIMMEGDGKGEEKGGDGNVNGDPLMSFNDNRIHTNISSPSPSPSFGLPDLCSYEESHSLQLLIGDYYQTIRPKGQKQRKLKSHQKPNQINNPNEDKNIKTETETKTAAESESAAMTL